MSSYQRKTPIKNDCAVEKALLVISGKWKPAILSELLKRTIRLKDIQEGLPEASKRALTQQLKEMIDDGLIQKKDFNQYPKKTEYSITPLGSKLSSVFDVLTSFGNQLE
ncbi:winged helix-turn-helix transcriptional regulator [Aquimarina sediminis]|uniref:winged helix-turn-helix transcriptional regulator n=1 Tax=Aquimarina sediminis TaxID=2070536 RepID=UPI000CA04A37|nr:helix-turn-helix domain-containing protein [Aquimarina sediminis]